MDNREIKVLNIDDILPNRFQPRIKFDEKAINELAESIKIHGVIQPIVVRKVSDKYEIIAGERRYKASVLAGKQAIPAIITTLDDKESAEIALIENVQRQDLTPIEEAISYKKILDMGYLNQIELGDKLGKNQSTIANKLRLLNLEEEVQDALMENKISERHARSLLRLNSKQQVEMLNRVVSERLTVRRLDEEIEKLLSGEDNTEKEIERVENMNNSDILKEMGIPTSPIIDENVQNIVPNEEQSINQTLDNLTFNIPTIDEITPVTKIGEEVESAPIEQVQSVEQPVEEIQTLEPIGASSNVEQSINPGFMDIDKIESTAENVYQEKAPVADIDKLMDTSNNPQVEEISPFQPVENASAMNNEVAQENTNPFGIPGGGKFFSMFAQEEDTNPNFVKDVGSAEVNMEFNNQPVEPTFNFNTPVMNQEQVNIDTIPSMESNQESISNQEIQNNSSINPSSVFTMSQELPKENLEFTQTFQPFNLTDEETFTKPDQDVNIASTVEPVVKVEPITFDDMGEINVKLPEKQKLATADLKTVINTIRECAATIERFGFTIDTEEIDLENSYQVTFTIDKN